MFQSHVPIELQYDVFDCQCKLRMHNRSDMREETLQTHPDSGSVFKTALYDREKEIDTLQQLRCKIQEPNAPVQICFVHGSSGSGKTSLCEHPEWEPAVFAAGKFDQFQDFSAPYSAIVQAFDALGDELLSQATEKQREEIRESLEFESVILTQLIPSFSKLGQEHHKQEEHGLELASERLAVAFCSFLRLVCTPERPLVLFIDDLQWTDQNTLDLIKSIVNDSGTTNLLFIGGYRDDDDAEEKDRMQSFLETIRQNENVTDIPIHNLCPESVHALVADALSIPELDQEALQELTALVNDKTMGNPFFVLQFLRILKRDRLLSSNNNSKSKQEWECDIRRLTKEFRECENVGYFVSKRIMALPPGVRRVLKLAACLGFSVEVKLLEVLDRMEKTRNAKQKRRVLNENTALKLEAFIEEYKGVSFSGTDPSPSFEMDISYGSTVSGSEVFQRTLHRAEEEELIARTGAYLRFSHDRVQQCVYELIPEGMARSALHLRTGLNILDAFHESEDRYCYLFLAADQCNRGSECINTDSGRLGLVRLNLEASQTARTKAGVRMVASFLDKAAELLRDSDWSDTYGYKLALEVYNCSAEVESACGNFDRSNERVSTILKRAKSIDDTVQAIAVKALSRGAQQDYLGALSGARTALSLLGIEVPPSNRFRLLFAIYRMKRALKQKTEVNLLNLKSMTDSRMLLAMKILKAGVIWGWNADACFGSFSLLAMMRITLDHGMCFLTPFTFAGIGNLFARFTHDQDEGYRMGQLACRLDAGRDAIPGRTMLVHAYLSHLRTPASASLEPLLSAYRLSLEIGDLGMGSICLCCYHWVYKFVGLPLLPLVTDLKNFLTEIRQCRQDFILAMLLPDLLLALNLTGQTSDPSDISWKAIHESEDAFTYNDDVSSSHPADLNLCYSQLFNALVLGKLDKIEESLLCILARGTAFRRFDGSHIANQFFTFWEALACFALLRRRKVRRYKKLSNNAIEWLTRMSRAGSVNCVGMLKFLLAEKASLLTSRNVMIDSSTVQSLYDQAIAQLSKTGFLHYSALANERAGEYMLRRHNDDRFWAKHYLSRAAVLYHDWNASVKVDSLLQAFDFVSLEPDENYSGFSCTFRARSRFDRSIDSFHAVSAEQRTAASS